MSSIVNPTTQEWISQQNRNIVFRFNEMCTEMIAEQKRIAAILAEFYRAPLSMASVQPILDLAVELNPELKEKK